MEDGLKSIVITLLNSVGGCLKKIGENISDIGEDIDNFVYDWEENIR